jgi:hypothetical protein
MVCPNKTFKSDPNQEMSDWDMLVEQVGELQAYAEFYKNDFQIPAIDKSNTKVINPRLIEILNNYGISVGAIDDYAREYKTRTGLTLPDGVSSVADIFTKQIALGRDADLYEEVGHFAEVASRTMPGYELALARVTKTKEYQDNYDFYFDKYKNERQVKQEILGKLLGNQIQEDLKPGLKKYVRKAIDWIKSILFSDQMKDWVKTASSEFVNLNATLTREDQVFYAKKKAPKELTVEEQAIKTIKTAIKLFSRKYFSSPRLRDDTIKFQKLLQTIELIGFDIGVIEIAKRLEEGIDEIAKDAQSGHAGIIHTYEFIQFFEPLLQDMKEYIKDKKEYKLPKAELEAMFEDSDDKMLVQKLLDTVKPFEKGGVVYSDSFEAYLAYLTKRFEDMQIWFDKASEDAVIDYITKLENVEDADKEKVKADILGSIKTTERTFWSNVFDQVTYWVGSIRSSKDPVTRAIVNKVLNIKTKVRIRSLERGKQLAEYVQSKLESTDTSWAAETVEVYNEKTKKTEKRYTGNFISPVKEAAYNEKKQSLYRYIELGEKSDRTAEEEIEVQKLADEFGHWGDVSAGNSNKVLAMWFKANTQPIPNVNETIKFYENKLKKGSLAHQEWIKKNMIIDKFGEVTAYKGMLAMPKVEVWRNEDYFNLTDAQRDVLNYMMKVKEEADRRLPFYVKKTKAPQMTGSVTSLMSSGRYNEAFKEATIGQLQIDQDTDRGVDDFQIQRPDGTIARFVPTHFIADLTDMQRLSTDFITSLTAYAEMADNFQVMTTESGALDMVLLKMKDRDVITASGKQRGGTPADIINTFLDMQTYGFMNEQGQEIDLPIFGGKTNGAKLMNAFISYINTSALGLNAFTLATNFFSGKFNYTLDKIAGDLPYARNFWNTQHDLVQAAFSEMGKPIKTTKLGKALQDHFVVKSEMHDYDTKRLTKVAIDSGLYFGYSTVEFFIRGPIAMDVMMSYKLIDGKFYKWPKTSVFEKKDKELRVKGFTKEEFDKLPSYYDNYEKASQDDRVRIIREIDFLADRVEQKLSPEDFGKLHQSILGKLVTTLRGWLFKGIADKFKPAGYNYDLQKYDVGYVGYATSFYSRQIGGLLNYITAAAPFAARPQKFNEYFAKWSELEPYEKEAVRKATTQSAMAIALAAFAIIINGLAEEEDEWELHFAAYLANRALLEATAFQVGPVPIGITQSLEIIQSPIAGTRQVQNILDLIQVWEYFEVLESGPNKGDFKIERNIKKLIPGVKGLYGNQDPESMNQYLKSKVMNWMY